MARILKFLAAILLLTAMILMVDGREMLRVLSQVDFFYLSVLLLWSVLLIYVSVLKWQLFLEFYQARVSTVKLFALYLVGYFFSAFLPSHVGGDLVRSWCLGKDTGQKEALSATILERYTGLTTMLFCSCLGVVFYQGIPQQIVWFVLGVCAVFICASVAALSGSLTEFIGRIFEQVFNRKMPFLGKIKTLQVALRSILGAPGVLVKSAFLSLLFFVLAVFNVALAAYAIGWSDMPFGGVFTVLPLILVLGSIPLTPSGLGIQEGAFFYFLQQLGATPSQALAIGLILRAKWVVLALCGGVVWMVISTAGGTKSPGTGKHEKPNLSAS